jgi:glucan phosphoethanolaminetransferase (alkaline phosphatase superfamily)
MKGNIKIQLPFWFITIFAVVIFSVFFRKLSQNALYNNLIVVVLTLSLLAILAMLFYKAFKITAENNEKQKEFERKKEWEEFQYNLHKEERA